MMRILRYGAALFLVLLSFMGLSPAAQAAFPGVNGRIAYIHHDGLYTHIYSMNDDGTDQTELTFGAVTDLSPEWSPDGSKILFLREATPGSALYVMRSDGTGLKRVTPRRIVAYFGSWSSAGDEIVFANGSCLGIVKADGTSPRRLLCGGFSESPKWSPSGDLIVFSYVPPSGGFNLLWTIRPDGTGLSELTYSGIPDLSPDWAPDATHIAFERSGYPTSDIYLIDADGANPTDLTANAPTDVNGWPAYSPDGSLIAYDGGRSGIYGTDVFVMNANGSNFVRLTRDGLSAAPAWQPLPVGT
jgi:Tol biopolymer transport system component